MIAWSALGLGAIAAVAIIWSLTRAAPELDCATAFRTASSGVAVTVCQREYVHTRNPATGINLVNALRLSGDLVAADALAKELLVTEVRGDALQAQGRIANAQRRTDEAIKLLQDARRWHREHDNHSGVAIDSQILAEIAIPGEHFADALQLLEECVADARAGADPHTEALCHLSSARVLLAAGYFEAAYGELDRAAALLSEPRDLAVLWQWRGQLELPRTSSPFHHAHLELAVSAFERSLELAIRGQRNTILVNLHLDLAYSLAELGKVNEAQRHLDEAGLVDPKGTYAQQRAQLAARIAYRRGNLALALRLNDQAYDSSDELDEQIDISVMQARIALSLGDAKNAERWARRGVECAEKARSAQGSGELRPWVLASRREPFELLFKVLANAHRFEDAASVFDRWQGRTLLEEMARPSADPSPGLARTASRFENLSRWLPTVAKAPLMSVDDREVKQTLQTVDLVALAVAEGEIWRLTSSRASEVSPRIVHAQDLGPAEALRDLLDRFAADPTDAGLASKLGELILPDEVVRKTRDPLYVVLDAPLGGIPFVALRKNGQPVIASRPVIRAPRIPVTGACPAHADNGSALVLADAAGDLPGARLESSKIASLFGTTPLVGAAATSAALFAGKSARVLHFAVHADLDTGGGVLQLYDRGVSAAEISANKLGPPLVVLAACSTARSRDPELAGALSTAFLAGGSQRVIATLRKVSDAGARELINQFYDAQGADDPVQVLADVQAKLATSDNRDWPNFAVFATDVCGPRS